MRSRSVLLPTFPEGNARRLRWPALLFRRRIGCFLSSLDLRHQVEVLTTARRVATKQGKGVILSMHDINLATRYADTILLMKDGGIVASGAPADVLTGERIASVYGLPMRAFHAADNPQVSLWFPDTTEEGAVFPSRSGIFQEEDMEQ